MRISGDLRTFFAETLGPLSCEEETKAYIVGLLASYKSAVNDLSKQNITLTYSEAYSQQSFALHQTLADWIFTCQVMFPEHLHRASTDYYFDIGRLSYYACYRLIDRRWKIYQELADSMIPLVHEVKLTLKPDIDR